MTWENTAFGKKSVRLAAAANHAAVKRGEQLTAFQEWKEADSKLSSDAYGAHI